MKLAEEYCWAITQTTRE